MAETAAHWRDGLDEVGACPHCGAPVLVRPTAIRPDGRPEVVYLCDCRHAAAAVTVTPSPPPAGPTRWLMPPQAWEADRSAEPPVVAPPPAPGRRPPPDIWCGHPPAGCRPTLG